MSTPNPTRAGLSAEARHVIDSLEAHLGVVLEHAKAAAPGAAAEIAKFGGLVLDKLELWGVELRGEAEVLRGKLNAVAPAPTPLPAGAPAVEPSAAAAQPPVEHVSG